MNTFIKTLISFIVLSLSFETLAIDMDYYAPNGLPTVGDAFTRLALIFSDSDYYFALPIIGALALVIAVINGYLIKPLTTGNNDQPINIFAPLIIGTVIWVAGFAQTATLHVYDPVKNDTQSVAGIPQVIVLVAGLTNILERNMIEITETGTAYPYSETAGGINLELFLNAHRKGRINSKKFLTKDIKSYYNNCGQIGMVIAGNQTIEDLMSTTPDLFNILSEWTHPSLFVNLYNGTPGMLNMSCTDGWNNVIKPGLVATVFDKDVAEVCAQSGYDPLKSAQLQACKSRLGDLKEIHGLSATTANNYLRDSMIADSILKQINANDPTQAQQALARRQLALQGLGALNVAQDTQPNIKAVMTAIILGIIPFLALFLLTPLWSKALKFMTGSLLWLTTWGVMMAVMHVATMDQAMIILSDIANNKMGLDSFMLAQTDGVKAFMLFGKMQSNSLMMATAIAIAVYGFGSYAMTGIAQGQAQSMQHMGEGAAQQALTPEGRAGVRQGFASGTASDAGIQQEALFNSGHGSEAQMQQSLGNEAKNMRRGLGTDIGANAAIGEFDAAADAGRGQSYQDFSKMTGAPIADNATANAYAQTNQGQADAKLLSEMQQVAGAGDSQSGAALFASSNGEQFAKLDKLQNMAELRGMSPNSPQALMTINEDLADDGRLNMTGSQIANNDILTRNMSEGQIQQASNNPDTNYAVAPTFGKDAGGFMQVDNVKMESYQDMSKSQNTTESEISSVEKGNRENYSNTRKEGNYTENRDVNNFRDETLGGKTVDTSNNTTTGDFVTSGVGGNINSLLKGMQTPDASPGFAQSPHREALHNTFDAASANQTGAETTYLVNTLASDVGNIGQGTMSNNDIVSVAASESANVGWKVPSWAKKIGGLEGGIGAGVNSKQEQSWQETTQSNLHQANIRSMLEQSNGDLDKFGESYMGYKNALIERSKEDAQGSDLEGYKK